MKKWQIAAVVVAVVAVAVAALFGGRAWGQSSPSNDADHAQATRQGPGDGNFPGMPGDGPQQGLPGSVGRDGRNVISGNIIAADATSITIKTSDGSTKIILISASTSVTKNVEGSLADLVTGEDVVITGTTNSDNSVTATSIVLGSTLGFGGAPDGIPPAGDGVTSDGAATQPTAQ